MSIVWHSMNDIPPKVTGENFSETVIIYGEKGEYQDLGYYDYEFKEWYLLGDFQMNMICWIWIPSFEKECLKFNEVLSPINKRKR